MKMKDRAHPRLSPSWGIRRLFRRGRKQRDSRFANLLKDGCRDAVDQATEPTDVSFATPTNVDCSLESVRCSEGRGRSISGSSVWEEGREEHLLILDHLSIAEASCTHLEVSLIDVREGSLSGREYHLGAGGVIYRTSILNPSLTCSHDSEVGTEIVLRLDKEHEQEYIFDDLPFEPTPDVRESPNDGMIANPNTQDALEVFTLNEVQRESVSTCVDVLAPQNAPTEPEDAPTHEKSTHPAVCQEASDHSPASDSLTWISHEKNCELIDDRPLKEISFRTLSQISEPADLKSEEPNEPATLLPSLPKGLREEIFATFHSASPELFVAGTETRHLVPQKVSEAPEDPVKATVEWQESLSTTRDRVEILLESLEKTRTEDAVLRSLESAKDTKDQESLSVDSTISSNSDSPKPDPPELPEESQRDNELVQLVRRVRSGDLKFTSAFESVHGLRSMSFDGAANLKNLAMQSWQSCGEANLPSCQLGDSHHHESLIDGLSDEDEESKRSSTGSAALVDRLSVPSRPTRRSSRSTANLSTPQILIREISTDDESSVMSESLTSESSIGTTFDDYEGEDEDDDNSSISSLPLKVVLRHHDESDHVSHGLLGDDEDDGDEESTLTYEKLLSGCLYS